MRFSGNKFLASPASGDNGIVEARALTAADIAAAGIEPGSDVVYEDAFDLAPDEGTSLKYAREDHSHGSPPNPIPDHVAEADPHVQYQKESERNDPNGYAGLSGGKLSASWMTGVMSSSGLTNDAALEKVANKDAPNGYPGLDANSRLALARLPLASAGVLLGRRAGGAGDFEPITLGANLSMSVAGVLSASGGGGGGSGNNYFPGGWG